MKGDDVAMVQTSINFFAWENIENIGVDGSWGHTTDNAVKRLLKQNYGSYWEQHYVGGLIRYITIHFKDYQKALNDFGWNDATPSNTQNAEMNDSYSDFKKESQTDDDGWVEQAATLLTKLSPNIITPNPNWSSDRRDLLLAIIEQESGKKHWKDWNVRISQKGAIGFLQVMSFNSSRYNDHSVANPIIDANLNIYKPDDNLKAAAKLLNEYLEKAFSGNWTKSGDDQDDLLAKALACYNGGRIATLSTNSWETICVEQKISLESLKFAVQIKNRLGLTIENFEEQYE